MQYASTTIFGGDKGFFNSDFSLSVERSGSASAAMEYMAQTEKHRDWAKQIEDAAAKMEENGQVVAASMVRHNAVKLAREGNRHIATKHFIVDFLRIGWIIF